MTRRFLWYVAAVLIAWSPLVLLWLLAVSSPQGRES
jgi:hypothetical protein